MRLARREPAQVMVLFALSVVGLMALLGLVFDGGTIYVQRRTAQASADAAALAGTRELRTASLLTPVGTIAAAVTTYAQANAFGSAPNVTCAYFVGTDGVTNLGTIINGGASCSGLPAVTIPPLASGVHVDVRIPFHTYVVGMLGIYNLDADGHSTAQVGVLTGFDARNAPLIACGGGLGGALWIPTLTPVVQTATPGSLAPTPASLPSFNPGTGDLVPDQLLVPVVGAPTPPAYQLDALKDGRVYYLKGQKLTGGSPSGDCGASGFKGAAATQQPTPYIKDTATGSDQIVWGDTGNSVPTISQRVASSSACPAGTNLDNFTGGSPGCVMVLPVAYDNAPSGAPGTRALKVGAWGAYYVWCLRSVGSGCQVIAGQFLADWPIAGGPSSVSTWTLGGATGGLTTIRLTS